MSTLQLSPTSRFHRTSLITRRSGDCQLHSPCSDITCSSTQSQWTRHNSCSPCPPISERHIPSLLTSSLQMQSPQGEALLAMTNERTPHVQMLEAASQQLNLLAADAAEICTRSKNGEGILQRRIAAVRECEINKALQDITLALVTHRLLHATLPVPSQTPCQHDDHVALDERLQAIHPPLLQPLVDRHVALVINGKDGAQLPFEPSRRARVCTLEMGKMYAASVMHGYFLARVYQRFKLERALKLETVSMDAFDEVGANKPKHIHSKEVVSMEAYLQLDAFKDGFCHLRSVRGSSTLNVIEHHCRALFGVHPNPFHTSSHLDIELASVKILILQALAFGAIMLDVESKVIPSF